MKIAAPTKGHLQKSATRLERSAARSFFDRGMLLDSLGLACYIAWSFVFWNGSLLFGELRPAAPMDGSQVIQGVSTALTALFLALSVRRGVPLRQRNLLLGVFAVISSLSVMLAALVGFGQAPLPWMLFGFALSGVGSTLRLGWEERLSVQGVHRTTLCAGAAYLFGFVAFVIVSLLPAVFALAVAVLLPFGAYVLLRIAVRGERERKVAETLPLKTQLAGIPWKLIAAIALAYFSYGATRMSGVTGGLVAAESIHGAIAGIPALASLVAIVLAYWFYRKNALLAFYLAFPLMALAALLPVALDPFAGGTTFWVALVGAELVKYLVWFLLIDSIIKDGISALLCVALMRFAQWGGSCLGQVAADALPSPEAVTISVLLSLMVALLVIMGLPLSGKMPVISTNANELDLDKRVGLAAERFKLSPREQEVLAIWATGHTGAYIEKTLFISKNTVKTHLNHIYAKTNTANREQLLELLDAIEE
ncbi:MAG: helix-turn-helix transcriptional regulator [Gordonibacter sp.]|nr:helix-turn-helix transcriptional regulator [Gordonibacter sp.]